MTQRDHRDPFPPINVQVIDSDQITDLRNITARDVRSFNWDGGSELEGGADTTATTGFFLDASAGAAQFQTMFADDMELTGNLFMTGSLSTIKTSDGTGFHLVIASGHSTQFKFMNGATEIGRFGVSAPSGAGEWQADSDIDILSGGDVFVSVGSGADFTVLANVGSGSRVSLVGDVSSMLIGGTTIGATASVGFSLSGGANYTCTDAGSLSSPAYGIADVPTNAGMYLAAENRLNFTVGGVAQLQLRADVPDFVSVLIGNNTTASAANVFCSASGIVERVTSSARFKTAIRPWDRRFDVLELEPVLFRSTTRADDSRKVRLGLLAEHVAEVFPMAATPGLDGQPEGIDWSTLTAALIGEVADLKRRVEALGG